MSVDNQEQQRTYEAELKKLEDKEVEKRMLYNKNIGHTLDLPPPRPTDDFIEKCVGKLKSNAELSADAQENALKRIRQAEAVVQRKQEVRLSMDAHNKRVMQQQQNMD